MIFLSSVQWLIHVFPQLKLNVEIAQKKLYHQMGQCVPAVCYMWSWQRITEDYEVLLRDQEDMKKKLEASRARNRVLSTEVKTLKNQISTLVEKGKHDDELVDALLVRTSC